MRRAPGEGGLAGAGTPRSEAPAPGRDGSSRWIPAGAIFAFLGVTAGAFGAHALRARVPAEQLAVFETGVRYQLVHALALVLLGLGEARWRGRAVTAAGFAFSAGILLFSGSLYALALTGARGWGAVTPFGGLGFLVGWAAFAAASITRRARREAG